MLWSFKNPSQILITGASGFIGANLAHRFVELGLRPHLLVRKGTRPWRLESILERVRLHECDLTNEQSVAKTVRKTKPQYIFHCAAHGAYPFQMDPKKILQTNLGGTIYLLNACVRSGFKLFIHYGSSSEYGFKSFAPDENTLPEPNSFYAASKLSATFHCQSVARSLKLPLATLRLYSVYGPYEEPTRLIPTLIRSCLEEKAPRLTSPKTARDFIHVDDVIDLSLLLLKKRFLPGEVFNAAMGRQSTIREVVQKVMKITGAQFPLHWGSLPSRIWDTSIWVGNNHKAKRTLGWRPKYSLSAGLRKTIEWYENHPEFLYGQS